MSANGETSTVLRGVTHGAVDFLIKPVRIAELRNVWQHVVRRKRTSSVRPHPCAHSPAPRILCHEPPSVPRPVWSCERLAAPTTAPAPNSRHLALVSSTDTAETSACEVISGQQENPVKGCTTRDAEPQMSEKGPSVQP